MVVHENCSVGMQRFLCVGMGFDIGRLATQNTLEVRDTELIYLNYDSLLKASW